MISTKDLTPGQTLKVQPNQVRDRSCLTFILGIIPVGDFSFTKVTQKVDELIEKSNSLALANIELEQDLTLFLPFYIKSCQEVIGSPMVKL